MIDKSKNYYDETDDITLYWELRYQEWLNNPSGPDWGVFVQKDRWFEERFSHVLPQRTPVGKVLEVGCGSAMYAVPLLRRFSTYTGFDTSETAIKLANTYFNQFPELFQRMYVSLYTGKPGNFETNVKEYYDCIISITVLQHQPIPYRVAMIENIKRLLKPGGLYIGLEMQGDTAAYDMPKFPTEDWIKAWEPIRIVQDIPAEHPAWAADNVWTGRK